MVFEAPWWILGGLSYCSFYFCLCLKISIIQSFKKYICCHRMTKNRKGGKGQAICVHLSPLLSVNVFPRILPVDFLLWSHWLERTGLLHLPCSHPYTSFLICLTNFEAKFVNKESWGCKTSFSQCCSKSLINSLLLLLYDLIFFNIAVCIFISCLKCFVE